MKCSFLDYVQLLMIGHAGRWTRTLSTTPLQPKNEMLIFGLSSLLMLGCAGRWTRTPSTTPLQPKSEMLIFGLCSTSDDWPGWLMDSNPICHPSPAKKMKCSTSDDRQGWLMDSNPIRHPSPAKKMECSFLDYVQLLMLAGLEPHLPPLSSQKNEMLNF